MVGKTINPNTKRTEFMLKINNNNNLQPYKNINFGAKKINFKDVADVYNSSLELFTSPDKKGKDIYEALEKNIQQRGKNNPEFEKKLFTIQNKVGNNLLHVALICGHRDIFHKLLQRKNINESLGEILEQRGQRQMSILDYLINSFDLQLLKSVINQISLNQIKDLFLIPKASRNNASIADDVISSRFFEEGYFESLGKKTATKSSPKTSAQNPKLEAGNDEEIDLLENVLKNPKLSEEFSEIEDEEEFEKWFANQTQKIEIDPDSTSSTDAQMITHNSNVVENDAQKAVEEENNELQDEVFYFVDAVPLIKDTQKFFKSFTTFIERIFKDTEFTKNMIEGKKVRERRKKDVLEYVDMDGNNILMYALKNKTLLNEACDAIQKSGDINLYKNLLIQRNLEGETVSGLLGDKFQSFDKYMLSGIQQAATKKTS